MAKKLTAYQKRLKQRLEELLFNFGFQQELAYLRRDTSSPLKTTENQAERDKRLLRLMEKFSIELDYFFILKKYCMESGEFDYSLTGSIPKTRPQAKRDHRIYLMWLHQGMRMSDIARTLQSEQQQIDVQHISKIIKRMRAKDPNPTRDFGPLSGHRY